MARQPANEARAHILDAAAGLFDAYGIRAVGMQQIIDSYGCGKNLLYREFPSKDDLVVAYLRRCRQDWPGHLTEVAQAHPDDPAEQLVALVRTVVAKSCLAGTRGCPLHNTYAEYPDVDHPAHQVAAEHFATVRNDLDDLAARTGAADPATLADRIMLIIDGVNANGAALGPGGAVGSAVSFAEETVAAAVGRPRSRPERG